MSKIEDGLPASIRTKLLNHVRIPRMAASDFTSRQPGISRMPAG
ncbi:MAG TPA: hypothetical protein VFL15_00640 [Gammaproteobacteria bacterium]|nr:hypothetical protein [Gammaproteobacteria bacterium]